MRTLTFNELNVVSGGESTCGCCAPMTLGGEIVVMSGALVIGAFVSMGVSSFALVALPSSLALRFSALVGILLFCEEAVVYAGNQFIDGVNKGRAAACPLEG